MISNHREFIEAIKERKKVSLRLYSIADSGIIDLVCAPLDYGPGPEPPDGVNRHWFWDNSRNNGSPILVLLPEQILDLSILGALFDPAGFTASHPTWKIPRDWSAPSEPGAESPTTGAVQTEIQPGSSKASHPASN
jgi:hypothetical protein